MTEKRHRDGWLPLSLATGAGILLIGMAAREVMAARWAAIFYGLPGLVLAGAGLDGLLRGNRR